MADDDTERQGASALRVKRRFIAVVVAVAVVTAFLLFFIFVPVVPMTTHGSDQLAFLRLPATESLSCVVFGYGTADWPTPPYTGMISQHYQIGCPPVSQP